MMKKLSIKDIMDFNRIIYTEIQKSRITALGNVGFYDNSNNVLHFDSDTLNTFQVSNSDFLVLSILDFNPTLPDSETDNITRVVNPIVSSKDNTILFTIAPDETEQKSYIYKKSSERLGNIRYIDYF